MGRIAVRVIPRASRTEVAGWNPDGTLRLRVAAPPVEDRANRAAVRFLAKTLGVPRHRVTVVAGQSSRSKIIDVADMTEEELRERLTDNDSKQEHRK